MAQQLLNVLYEAQNRIDVLEMTVKGYRVENNVLYGRISTLEDMNTTLKLKYQGGSEC